MKKILYLFSIVSFLNISLSYVVLPFEIYVKKYSEKKEEPNYNITRLLNEWFSFRLFSKIQIGNPVQEISVFINPQKSCFEFNRFSSDGLDLEELYHFFSDEENPIDITLFNLNNSKSFINVTNTYSGVYDSKNYLLGNDEIYFYNNFKEINSKNLNKTNGLYFLVNINNYWGSDCRQVNCGLHIGMTIFYKDINCPNFNNELKKANLTNKYIFSIHYNSNKSGSIIIGAYPHEYLKNNYKEEHLYTFYTMPSDDSKEIYNFNMQAEIKTSNTTDGKEIIISGDTKVIFEFYYGFFIGTHLYQEYIESYFFNDLIQKDICYKANRTNYSVMKFDLYYCKEEYLKEIKKFPELNFYLKNTNTSFIFNFDDLFTKIGNKYYFLVIFEKYERSYFEVGFPFFKKYDIVFNEDSKTISYYNKIDEKDENIDNKIDKKEKSKIFKIIVIIILGVILICLILGVGFYFGKLKYMQRKKRANEMKDDEYEYPETDNMINNDETNE